MIAKRGPNHRFSQHIGVNIEDRPLIFPIVTGVVSIISKHEPKVGMTRTGPILVSIAHRDLILRHGAKIADHPYASWFGLTGLGSGNEEMGAITARKHTEA